MEHVSVDSSNIASVGYEDGIMEVTFKHGGTYRYADVDEEQFDRMMAAESVGKFLNSLGIKGRKL